MPDPLPPSEFGGKVQKNRIQPPATPEGGAGHQPSVSEQLLLMYTTGQIEDSTRDPEKLGESFQGLLTYEEQLQKRIDEGVITD